jgi:beta-carotene 3-hydroxylase
MPII